MKKERLNEALRIYKCIDSLKELQSIFINGSPSIIGFNFLDVSQEVYDDWKKINETFLAEKIDELEIVLEDL